MILATTASGASRERRGKESQVDAGKHFLHRAVSDPRHLLESVQFSPDLRGGFGIALFECGE